MTSTRDLLDAALAHWADYDALMPAIGPEHSADHEAFARAVPRIADVLEAAAAIEDSITQAGESHTYTEIHTVDMVRLRAAIAALEAN